MDILTLMHIQSIVMNINMASPVKLNRLLQLCSANLPVGGFSFSQGLEYAIEMGWISNQKTTFEWIELNLNESIARTDLALLKAIAHSDKQPTVDEKEEGADGFASAIAGIFDGLDGDDALLDGYPNVKFFEDSSLQSGDCQIKSRFGLLDGRVSTKIRKIEDELKRND